MKIIGHMKDGYILDCTTDEIGNLFGYETHYQLPQIQRREDRLKIGSDVPVADIYATITNARNYRDTIEYCGKQYSELGRKITYLSELLALAEENARKIKEPEVTA